MSAYFKWSEIKQFILGGLLGSAPMWAVVYFLLSSGYKNDPTISATILFISTIISGVLAGYFVAKTTDIEIQNLSILTGVMCYFFLSIIFSVFSFQGELIEETSPFFGFFLGAALGAKLWENVGEEYEYIEVDEDFNEDDLKTDEEK